MEGCSYSKMRLSRPSRFAQRGTRVIQLDSLDVHPLSSKRHGVATALSQSSPDSKSNPTPVETLMGLTFLPNLTPAQLRLLSMKGTVPDTQDETGRTSLHQAAVAGDAEEVLRLLSGGASPNTQDAHLQTPVTLAAERGLYGVVKTLAEHSATDINLQDSFGRTPLHWCAKRCDVKGLQALLGTGKANVNTKTTGGDTALHWACSGEGGDASAEGNFEERSLRSAEVLIGAGADIRAKNDRDERAQDLATDGAVVALLLSATEELHKQEENEATETERNRVAAAEAKLSSASAGPTAAASMGAAAAWPEKQPNVGLAFSKQGSGSVVGAKKKMVIKLKKKS